MRQFRVTLALTSTRTVSALLDHVEAVVPSRSGKEMVFADTRRIVASVQGTMSFGKWSVDVLIDKAVREAFERIACGTARLTHFLERCFGVVGAFFHCPFFGRRS
jgi:hypothetical protein